MPKGVDDEFGRNLLHMMLAYAYPKPVRMEHLSKFFGDFNRVRSLLSALDSKVYEEGVVCGLTDWEAERLEELNRKWIDRSA